MGLWIPEYLFWPKLYPAHSARPSARAAVPWVMIVPPFSSVVGEGGRRVHSSDPDAASGGFLLACLRYQ